MQATQRSSSASTSQAKVSRSIRCSLWQTEKFVGQSDS